MGVITDRGHLGFPGGEVSRDSLLKNHPRHSKNELPLRGLSDQRVARLAFILSGLSSLVGCSQAQGAPWSKGKFFKIDRATSTSPRQVRMVATSEGFFVTWLSIPTNSTRFGNLELMARRLNFEGEFLSGVTFLAELYSAGIFYSDYGLTYTNNSLVFIFDYSGTNSLRTVLISFSTLSNSSPLSFLSIDPVAQVGLRHPSINSKNGVLCGTWISNRSSRLALFNMTTPFPPSVSYDIDSGASRAFTFSTCFWEDQSIRVLVTFRRSLNSTNEYDLELHSADENGAPTGGSISIGNVTAQPSSFADESTVAQCGNGTLVAWTSKWSANAFETNIYGKHYINNFNSSLDLTLPNITGSIAPIQSLPRLVELDGNECMLFYHQVAFPLSRGIEDSLAFVHFSSSMAMIDSANLYSLNEASNTITINDLAAKRSDYAVMSCWSGSLFDPSSMSRVNGVFCGMLFDPSTTREPTPAPTPAPPTPVPPTPSPTPQSTNGTTQSGDFRFENGSVQIELILLIGLVGLCVSGMAGALFFYSQRAKRQQELVEVGSDEGGAEEKNRIELTLLDEVRESGAALGGRHKTSNYIRFPTMASTVNGHLPSDVYSNILNPDERDNVGYEKPNVPLGGPPEAGYEDVSSAMKPKKEGYGDSKLMEQTKEPEYFDEAPLGKGAASPKGDYEDVSSAMKPKKEGYGNSKLMEQAKEPEYFDEAPLGKGAAIPKGDYEDVSSALNS